jgi:glutaredoxin
MHKSWMIGALVAAAALLAQAQQVYRIVGPDGKVTFSDKPPPPSANAKVSTGRAGGSDANEGGAGLPFELRGAVQRYPVTLYTMIDCAPCDSGRSLLRSRGVPFTERTVSSPQDSEALRRLAGDTTLPLLTVGSQQLKGYSDGDWSQYLDAAGYPKISQLPNGYRNPAPTPLVARAATPPATAPAATAAPAEPALAPPPATNPDNPAGIRF